MNRRHLLNWFKIEHQEHYWTPCYLRTYSLPVCVSLFFIPFFILVRLIHFLAPMFDFRHQTDFNSWISFFTLLNTGTTRVYHCAQFHKLFYITYMRYCSLSNSQLEFSGLKISCNILLNTSFFSLYLDFSYDNFKNTIKLNLF